MAAFSASYKLYVKHYFLPIGQLGGQGYYQTTIAPYFGANIVPTGGINQNSMLCCSLRDIRRNITPKS
jgi:2-keto-3-deoxy-6-phosphogluconate aldolase